MKKQRWRFTKGKKWSCDGCREKMKVYAEYKPEYCCNGIECGCFGLPVNPIFCDPCADMFFGRTAVKE
jgi:hypothetical protein